MIWIKAALVVCSDTTPRKISKHTCTFNVIVNQVVTITPEAQHTMIIIAPCVMKDSYESYALQLAPNTIFYLFLFAYVMAGRAARFFRRAGAASKLEKFL